MYQKGTSKYLTYPNSAINPAYQVNDLISQDISPTVDGVSVSLIVKLDMVNDWKIYPREKWFEFKVAGSSRQLILR